MPEITRNGRKTTPPEDSTAVSDVYADAEEPTSENLLKKYELGKLLGCGAFAKVYHGRDLRTGQSVAIKSMSKQRILKGNLRGNIKREISIMHRLGHPNIVRLVEVLATKTKIYFVMEFAKGGELFSKIARGIFSEDLSRKYFQQLISAVGYCHSRGVYHRDLKLENLLLDEKWELKVTDFGLSAVTDQIRPDGLLHTLCGTPAYVAPEILAKQGYDGAKVDVWSCGIILFVLNAGYLPFNDTNWMAMSRKIYRGEFRCPRWTSPELKRFLTRVLDPNPTTRITVDEILNDPWFQQGYKYNQTNIPGERELELKETREETRFLNAFDLISHSSGMDLSGLFRSNEKSVKKERFVSSESQETIMGRIEEVAEEEGMKVVKKGTAVARLEKEKGNCAVKVDINRLTEELVVVDVTMAGWEEEDIWKERMKQRLNDLIHQSEEMVVDD